MANDNEELIQFRLDGISGGRSVYICMPRKQYERIMPPSLQEPVEVPGSGNEDERCHPNGHTWGDYSLRSEDARDGYKRECLVCGREAIREWSA